MASITVPNPYGQNVAIGPTNGLGGLHEAPETKYGLDKVVGGAAKEVAGAVDRWQEEIDRTNAKDAINKTQQQLFDLENNQENGWANILGENALKRPDGKSLDEFYQDIRAKYPSQLLMADCSTLDEMLHAAELGFDFVGTTLVGYTEESKGLHIESNDFEIIRELLSKIDKPVIAEGNIDTPAKAKRVLELGSYSVVVGSIITRPQVITKRFAEAIG